MKKKNKPEKDESLVPLLESEEARLSAWLQKARDDGETRLNKAKADAADRLDAAMAGMRKSMMAEREQGLAGIRGEMERKRQGEERDLAGFETSCRSRIAEAAALLLEFVYGSLADDK
jgi:hypothetical protein